MVYSYHTTWKNKSQNNFINYCFTYNTKSLHDFNHDFYFTYLKVLEWSNQKSFNITSFAQFTLSFRFLYLRFSYLFYKPSLRYWPPSKKPLDIFNIASYKAIIIIIRVYFFNLIYTDINCCTVPLMLYFFQILYKFKLTPKLAIM